MPSFLSSLQGRAQAAIDKSGLATKIPGMTHTTQAEQPLDEHGNPTNAPAAGSSNNPDGRAGKPFMLENLTNQFKMLHNQYTPQGPPEVRQLQVLITNAKGVKIDYEGVGRDTKALSKDFYLWGQEQEEDVKDVTDRLAYLNFTQGMLNSSLSDKIDESRGPFKKLREAQIALAPRRAARVTIETQIRNIQGNPSKVTGADSRVQELHQSLQQHIHEDDPLEREVGELKRKAIRDSERMKWEAVKEYAEKLLLVAQTAHIVLEQLPSVAPSAQQPYKGQTATAGARTTLQEALDHYQPGTTTLHGGNRGGVGSNIDTRSFGESHASELSRVSSFNTGNMPGTGVGHAQPQAQAQAQAQPQAQGQPMAYPTSTYGSPSAYGSTSAPGVHSPGEGIGGFRQDSHPAPGPVNPAALNNTPAHIPASSSNIQNIPGTQGPNVMNPPGMSTASPDAYSVDTSASAVPAGPTVAETGTPLTGGPGGPGPASGNLSRDNTTANTGGGVPGYSQGIGGFRSDMGTGHESAEDEKRRLEREQRDHILGAGTAGATGGQAPAAYESADDEKKRLEREEREKLLRGGGSAQPPPPSGTPPPYI